MDYSLYTQQVAALLLSAVFIIAAVGSFLPLLPGPMLAFAGVLVYKLLFPQSLEGWSLIWFSGAAALVSQIADYAFTYFGSKKMGATWKGALGAIIGAIAGIFIPPMILWIFLAPLIFALLFELLGGRPLGEAAKAGLGAFLGTGLSAVFRFAVVVSIGAGFWLGVRFG